MTSARSIAPIPRVQNAATSSIRGGPADTRVEAAEIAAQFTSMSGDRLRELAR
jgi:hypothetical protein